MTGLLQRQRRDHDIEIVWLLGYWAGIAVPLLVYVGYPALAELLARRRPEPVLADAKPWPTVTVAVAVHNEERDIERAVRSAFAQEYPGPPIRVLVGLDGCTDGTQAVLDSIADTRLGYVVLPRRGKAATDNSLVAAATTDIVLTTAAGSEFAPGTIRRLAEPFRDPTVGCTTGVFAPRQDGSAAAGGEGVYWQLEYALMAAEAKLGVLAAASGTCMAHRRSIFAPIPLDSDGDVAIAPNAVLAGYRVVFIRDAQVVDDGPPDLDAVLRNRRRMALRALPTTWTFVWRLLARRRVGPAVSLVMHKLLRWLTPLFILVWAISAVMLAAAGEIEYTRFSLAILAVAGLGVVAVLAGGPSRRGALASLAVAQLAFFLATIDALVGRRARMWTRS